MIKFFDIEKSIGSHTTLSSCQGQTIWRGSPLDLEKVCWVKLYYNIYHRLSYFVFFWKRKTDIWVGNLANPLSWVQFVRKTSHVRIWISNICEHRKI